MNSTPLRTVLAGATDVGRRRSGNEDSYEIWVSDDLGRDHAADTLLVVCDGMGGSNAGEVASRMAVETVVREFAADVREDAVQALAHAVEQANEEVHEHSRSRVDLQGMGTTCTVVALKGGRAFFAQVGDSRAYLVRGGRIRQLTTDHSLVAQLVARNQLTPEEAKTDPRRNVVTRSVGVGPTVEVDAMEVDEPLRPGDTLLVCSDGLHGLVSDEEIGQAASGASLDGACRELIALANQRGGPDNITVVMARVEAPEDAGPAPGRAGGGASASGTPRPGGSRQRSLRLLIVFLIVLVLVLTGIAWVVFGKMRASDGAQSSARDVRPPGERLAWR